MTDAEGLRGWVQLTPPSLFLGTDGPASLPSDGLSGALLRHQLWSDLE